MISSLLARYGREAQGFVLGAGAAFLYAAVAGALSPWLPFAGLMLLGLAALILSAAAAFVATRGDGPVPDLDATVVLPRVPVDLDATTVNLTRVGAQ